VRFLFLVFIAVPLVEMLLLFEVAEEIGGMTTLGLVVLTAVIGVQILKQQGFSTLLRANERLESGQLPAQEIVEGMMLAGAGALLLTPGFITDTVGFILLTGPLRRPLAQRVIKAGIVHTFSSGSGRGFSYQTRRDPRAGGNVYEGEYSRPDDPRLGESPAEKQKDNE
jgi:UPF0716 protein FxsA